MPFIYPTSAELRSIDQELVVRGRAGRIGLDIMPVRGVNAAKVRWTQQDNYVGLQQMRGLDGEPLHVKRIGQNTYEYEPGVFGEFQDITETELTIRAGSVDVATTPIDVQDLVVGAKNQLVGRELDRQESSVWKLLTTGTIEITLAGINGTQIGWSESFDIQTYTAAVGWGTSGSATPLLNFQAVGQLGIGRGVNFGASATAYMNSYTANNLLNNTNTSDLGGRRVGGGNTINTLADIRQMIVAQEGPRIVTYDAGYIADGVGQEFQLFIPNNKVVVVGSRPSGARIGEYILTRNASAGYRPVSYDYVIDRANGGGQGGGNGEKRTPANIEVHRGHNGGPVIYWPSAVVVMNV
jgi:hypothetical protein